jgi:hypothetical protein
MKKFTIFSGRKTHGQIANQMWQRCSKKQNLNMCRGWIYLFANSVLNFFLKKKIFFWSAASLNVKFTHSFKICADLTYAQM